MSVRYFRVGVALLACFVQISHSSPVRIVDFITSMKFLNNFGYLSDKAMDMKSGNEKMDEMKSAMKMYQKYYHLNATGNLDTKTMQMMNSPRCGNKDDAVVEQMKHPNRTKRFVINSKWEKRRLTYRFLNYANCCLTRDQIHQEFEAAVQMWMTVVTPGLQIHKEVDNAKTVDIEIEFVKGPHHDNMSFANMNTVAHAFYPKQIGKHPIRGDIHYNDEEKWTTGHSKEGQNFLQTSCHELGHSLGLEHSMAYKAVMFAMVETYNPQFHLHSDDISGIKSLYKTESSVAEGDNELEIEPEASTFVEPEIKKSTTIRTNGVNFEGNDDGDLDTAASTYVQSDVGDFAGLNHGMRHLFPALHQHFQPESRSFIPTSEHGQNLNPRQNQGTDWRAAASEFEYNNPEVTIPRKHHDNVQLSNHNWQAYCTSYLTSKILHQDSLSTFCLQYLWSEFYKNYQ